MAGKRGKVTRIPEPEFAKPDAKAMATFENFWKDIVCNKNGSLNRNAVIKELSDYSFLLDSVPKVYDHITGGKCTKPNTYPSVVIGLATDNENEALEQILKDEKERWLEEYEQTPVVDVCHVALGGKTLLFPGRHARVTTPDGIFTVAWCSATDQLFTDDTHPLPHDWRDTAREAIKTLLKETAR